MSGYLPYNLVKHYWAGKRSIGTPLSQPAPVLDAANEEFLHQVIQGDEEPAQRSESSQNLDPMAVDLDPSISQEKSKNKVSRKKSKSGWLSSKSLSLKKSGLHGNKVASPREVARDEDELSQVLDDLNLSATNGRAFSLSKESTELVQKFTLVLKDLINGVPTACDDLVHLLESSQGTLQKSYDGLPGFLKTMVKQLLEKSKGKMAATAGPGLFTKGAALGGASMWESLVKPQILVSLLREILLMLRLRWPAFMATNVLLSLSLFMLLFVLWYCHKRGREERLEREAKSNSKGQGMEPEVPKEAPDDAV